MGIQNKAAKPAGITNASGQPEIVLEIDGLTITMAPPGKPAAAVPNDDEPTNETANETATETANEPR